MFALNRSTSRRPTEIPLDASRASRRVEELAPMTAGAIIITVIAASGVLMMRFRKRWLAKINIGFTNRITSLFAGWLPGFGILAHVGRKSGKVYRTPVNVFRAANGFIVALTHLHELQLGLNCLTTLDEVSVTSVTDSRRSSIVEILIALTDQRSKREIAYVGGRIIPDPITFMLAKCRTRPLGGKLRWS